MIAHLIDRDAERCLAAIVADSRRGADLATEHGVTAADFTMPPYRRVFAAAIALGEQLTIGERLDVIATEVEVEPGWLADLVDPTERGCFADIAGHYARRVIASGRRRDEAQAALDLLERLASEAA